MIGYICQFIQIVMIIGPKNDPNWAIASIIPAHVAWILVGKASVVKKNNNRVKPSAE
jgi:hypothetical protein